MAKEKPEKPLTPARILDMLMSGEITPEQAKELEEKRRNKPIAFKWGKKGTACITGIRRFPVINLYPNEVEKVQEVWDAFLDFVAEGNPADKGEEADTPAEEGEEEAA